jgi:hypothetical protein
MLLSMPIKSKITFLAHNGKIISSLSSNAGLYGDIAATYHALTGAREN